MHSLLWDIMGLSYEMITVFVASFLCLRWDNRRVVPWHPSEERFVFWAKVLVEITVEHGIDAGVSQAQNVSHPVNNGIRLVESGVRL